MASVPVYLSVTVSVIFAVTGEPNSAGAFHFTDDPVPVNVPASAVHSKVMADTGGLGVGHNSRHLQFFVGVGEPCGLVRSAADRSKLLITGGAFVTDRGL